MPCIKSPEEPRTHTTCTRLDTTTARIGCRHGSYTNKQLLQRPQSPANHNPAPHLLLPYQHHRANQQPPPAALVHALCGRRGLASGRRPACCCSRRRGLLLRLLGGRWRRRGLQSQEPGVLHLPSTSTKAGIRYVFHNTVRGKVNMGCCPQSCKPCHLTPCCCPLGPPNSGTPPLSAHPAFRSLKVIVPAVTTRRRHFTLHSVVYLPRCQSIGHALLLALLHWARFEVGWYLLQPPSPAPAACRPWAAPCPPAAPPRSPPAPPPPCRPPHRRP